MEKRIRIKKVDDIVPIHVLSYGLIEDIERVENSHDDLTCSDKWLDPCHEQEEEPYPLWASLGTSKLDDKSITDPILSTLREVWIKAKQKKQNIIPLSELVEVK